MKNKKLRLFTFAVTAICMSVLFVTVFADWVVPYTTSVPCIHGPSYHTVPSMEIVYGSDDTYHWTATNNFDKCSVSGCNGKSFTGQSNHVKSRHSATGYNSDLCSGGWHYYYANCSENTCGRRFVYAKYKCNGISHPGPYVLSELIK